jgi:glycosyltransferase involved in cell wall biosynthesis
MKVFVYDPTQTDEKSAVRGVGRYLQILKENFPQWNFSGNLQPTHYNLQPIFINPFFNLLQPPLLIRRIAKKQIAVIHDLIPLKYPKNFPIGIRGKINLFLNRLVLKNYDLIVTDSQASKKDIIDILKVKEEKVKVIYPCLTKIFENKSQIPNPKSQTDSQYRINSKRLEFENSNLFGNWNLKFGAFCLYVGDATWNKNLVNLAKAIKIINVTCIFVGKVFEISRLRDVRHPFARNGKQENKDTKFLAIWEVRSKASTPTEIKKFSTEYSHPWQKELKEFFHMTKDDKRFIFTGYVADDQLRELYQRARVNLLLSRDEGFGFSYLEAAQFQCPSVLADIPALREISDGHGALFANPNDPNEIANQIGEIYFNLDKRSQLGERAYQRSKDFTPEKFKQEFLKVIAQ